MLEIFDIEYKGLTNQPIFIKPAILIMILWRWVGYNMMIMLAGLQSIPHELFEAARIDGASGLQAFLHITVPLMRRVIAFAAILSTIGMFNVFEEAYMLVGPSGGVDRAGLLMGLHYLQTGLCQQIQIRLCLRARLRQRCNYNRPIFPADFCH